MLTMKHLSIWWKNICILEKLIKQKVMLSILKLPTKFGSVSQSFCRNLNPAQNQNHDHDFTLDFNTRTTFYT